MLNYLDTLIPYYNGEITQIRPIANIPIIKVFNAIKFPKPENVELIQMIRSCKDEGTKAELKKKLFAFTPAVRVKETRCYDSISEFTGFLQLDFDKLTDREFAEQLKVAIFNEFDFITAAWVSSSGKGVRAIARIPICNSISEFKEYYRGAYSKLGRIEGFDRAVQNCVLPMFYSIDTNLLIRENASILTERIPEIEQPSIPSYNAYESNKGKEKGIYTVIKRKIDVINDNGHPQLRATAYLLGGYVGAGYITESDALYMISGMIDGNSYLKHKSRTYKKTATTMIKKGQYEPVYFK